MNFNELRIIELESQRKDDNETILALRFILLKAFIKWDTLIREWNGQEINTEEIKNNCQNLIDKAVIDYLESSTGSRP